MERLFSPCTRFRDQQGEGRQSALARCFTHTMKRLFSPFIRCYRDAIEIQWRQMREELRGCLELLRELNLDVSTEEFLSAERAFTYTDLYAMLGNGDTLLWLTPHAAVGRGGERGLDSCLLRNQYCQLCFSVDGKDLSAFAHSPQHLLEICDVVLRLLGASVVHTVRLTNLSYPSGALIINAPSFAYLMGQCQSLKCLSFTYLKMDEDQIRVLGALSRPGLKIELIRCILTSAGSSALAEVLGRNQGPTKLDLCNIDNFVLANGLRGNSRLKVWRPRLPDNRDVCKRELLAIAGALKENKGLVDLSLRHDFRIRTDLAPWGAVCDSLKTHPTLHVLNLWSIHTSTGAPLDPVVLKTRIQALLGNMMKVNKSIHTIRLSERCYLREPELFPRSVIPYLETNRFRPRVHDIQKTCPIAYRYKVLGRALQAVRADPNRFWMLLSGNAEVGFPSTTATTTTLAAVAATAATRAASTTGASAAAPAPAAHVATPTTCHKHKARP
jgi:hypothetical protein